MLGKLLRQHYKIIKQLGSGGFGDTYLALDLDLPGQPQCVVKHLKPKDPNPAVLPIAKNLFEREAQMLHRLGNESSQIPKLFAHFEENGEFYLVQEFVDGHDLSFELIPGLPKNEKVVFKLLKDILEVLAVVHQHNVIHRDIKPQNIMRRSKDSLIVLIDFGAVKEVGVLGVNTQGQTSLTVAVGSPGYMPSEQSNRRPKLCSDVYASGMLGIQALTGLMLQELQEDPETGEVVWRDYAQVSDRLADVIDKMVRYDFRQRYQSADEALQALISTLPSPPPVPPTVFSPPQQSPSVSLLKPPPTQTQPEPSKKLQSFSFDVVNVNDRGQITNRRRTQTAYFIEDLGNGLTLEMVSIPGGRFLMGSPETEKQRSSNEGPQHQVTIAPFYMGIFAVTQAQWRAVAALPKVNRNLSLNPSSSEGVNRPVENVSWYDAVEFCTRISNKSRRKYSLPTEAE